MQNWNYIPRFHGFDSEISEELHNKISEWFIYLPKAALIV